MTELTNEQTLELKEFILFCIDERKTKYLKIHENIRRFFYECIDCKTINLYEQLYCRECGRFHSK